MESKGKTSKLSSKLRPRYGLIIATVSNNNNTVGGHFDTNSQTVELPVPMLDDIQWKQMCKKILKYKWSYTWNQTLPPSWTFANTQADSIPRPKLFLNDSPQLLDIVHNLLDTLPDHGSLGYLLDIFWITDKVPDDISNPMGHVNDGVNDEGLPAALYGALKRSFDWHGAHVHVLEIIPKECQLLDKKNLNDNKNENFLQVEVSAKISAIQTFLTSNDCFSTCKPKCSSDRLIWRGSLGFYDDADASLCVRRMRGFQLYSKDDKSHEVFNFIQENTSDDETSNILMSKTLKVISKCDVNTVPVYLLTSKHFYLTVSDNSDEMYDHFLCTEGEYFGNSGVIVKLDYASVQSKMPCKTEGTRLTFEYWKQYITNTQSYEESLDQIDVFESEQEYSTFSMCASSQSGHDNYDQSTNSLFFLIMNDVGGGLNGGVPFDNGRYTKLCILLDPSAAEGGGQLKSFHKMQDILYMKFEEEGQDLGQEKQKVEERLKELSIVSDYNAPKLYTFIRQVQSAVFAMIMNNEGAESEYLSKDRFQSTLDAIQMRILKKINAFRSENELPSNENDTNNDHDNYIDPMYYEEDDNLWDEKKFIAFMERLKKQKNANKYPTSVDTTMKPNPGDFVILEAKEMLKLFTAEGLAKNPDVCEEIKVPEGRKRGGFDWDKNAEKWPELLLSDYPDLCFNRNEKSEELDRERSKLQLMYVGSKETESTCHVQNSSKGPPPVVVTKKKEPGPVRVAEQSDSNRNTSNLNISPKLSKDHVKGKVNRSSATNSTQLRRSPRKKVSTASIINKSYRSGLYKPLSNIAVTDGRSSICSGENSSVISRKSLTNSSRYGFKQGKGINANSEVDEKGDSRTTRSGRLIESPSETSTRPKPKIDDTVVASRNAEETFKKKLREAVYDALGEQKISEDNKLFKPCFKKLFDICTMYGKDLANKNNRGSGTRQLLSKIAQQNVVSVINIQKTLFGD